MLAPITTNDIPLCAALFAGVYAAPPWNNALVTTEKAARYIGDLLKKPGFIGFSYRQDDTPVCAVLGTVNDYFFEPSYDIEELLVAPAYQRKGIGALMLSALEAFLTEQGVYTITLHTGRNIPAYDFYIKNGYQVVEDNVSLVKLM